MAAAAVEQIKNKVFSDSVGRGSRSIYIISPHVIDGFRSNGFWETNEKKIIKINNNSKSIDEFNPIRIISWSRPPFVNDLLIPREGSVEWGDFFSSPPGLTLPNIPIILSTREIVLSNIIIFLSFLSVNTLYGTHLHSYQLTIYKPSLLSRTVI